MKRRSHKLRRRYGRAERMHGGMCEGSGIGVRGLHETVRGQIQCPHCQRLLFPIDNVSPPPYVVLPSHGRSVR